MKLLPLALLGAMIAALPAHARADSPAPRPVIQPKTAPVTPAPAAPKAAPTPAAPKAAPAKDQANADPKPPPKVEAKDKAAVKGAWAKSIKVTGELDGKKHTAALLMYLPAGYGADPAKKHPLVLALHGWNHTPELFRDKGKLERWADAYGLVLAVPAMGKTVYETAFYPESKRTWGAIPGTRWVAEVILPYVRKSYAVAGDRAHTAVIGYSTGGRGALLLAEAYPELAFAGSASGTFDLMRLDPKDGEYKIHAVVYGPRDKLKERWELDNVVAPARLDKLAGTAIYAAHSGQDKIVKPDQLDALREALRDRAAIKAELALQPEGGAHDWPYWVSQWEPMFAAMAKALGLPPAK